MASRNCRFVCDENFVLATRDAGYRSLASAVAELLDNSIQAGAKCIRIFFSGEGDRCVEMAVLDDGSGMNAEGLRRALQFGGTSRFNDRSGYGRFGMGLPNSSFSQARRVEVYTWRSPRNVAFSYLDIDEISGGRLRTIPRPSLRPLPCWADPYAKRSGTLVIWQKCDRVPPVKKTLVHEQLQANLGRMYRYHVWDGLRMLLNDQPIHAVDPLLYDERSELHGALEFGPPLVYKMKVPRDPVRTVDMRVRFVEFPVGRWHDFSSEEKRRYGITRGAGTSIVRGKREVAFGWFFMGSKRKENYDDWWRCEIVFDPELDEYFGVTNTKQQISPTAELEETLSTDLEQIARSINARVRSVFLKVRNGSRASLVAGARDRLLPPATTLVSHKSCRTSKVSRRSCGGFHYSLKELASADDAFYSFRLCGKKLTLVLNTNHPFYKHMFLQGLSRERFNWECLLFALARAEAEAKSEREIQSYRRKRVRWSNVLATFLGN